LAETQAAHDVFRSDMLDSVARRRVRLTWGGRVERPRRYNGCAFMNLITKPRVQTIRS